MQGDEKMKYFIQRYVKQKAKKLLSSKLFSLFCSPLTRKDTRALNFLEPIYKTEGFELNSLRVNGSSIQLPVTVNYPESILFKADNFDNQNLRILPSGGICNQKKILCTGFSGQQAYNILGYVKSFLRKKEKITGTVICNWPQQFLTYGDFILQLLPALCLIKSSISQKEWSDAYFIFPRVPSFLIEYLNILGCNRSQIIDSRQHCFALAPQSKFYFREKDPMWFLCAPSDLLKITRKYFSPGEEIKRGSRKKILFVERLGGYRKAIGLDENVRRNLIEIGVSFFDPTGVPVKKQIETFANAEIVIGVHGAGIANLLWCRPNTKVIEIFHPKFAPWCYAILANQLNMDYYCIGRNPGSMDVNFRESDVNVDWGYLIELINQLKGYIPTYQEEECLTNGEIPTGA